MSDSSACASPGAEEAAARRERGAVSRAPFVRRCESPSTQVAAVPASARHVPDSIVASVPVTVPGEPPM